MQAWLPQVRAAKEQLAKQFTDVPACTSRTRTGRSRSTGGRHWTWMRPRPWSEKWPEALPGRAACGWSRASCAGTAGAGKEDKGTALRRLAAGSSCSTFAYAGDDRGDLPAFAAVAELGGYPLVVHGLEIAAEVEQVVGTHFQGPTDFADWLRRLSRL